MKISSITIKNFKGIEEGIFTPDKLNVFVGKNGTGKSSYIAAIAFALTGKVNPELIKAGEKSLHVLIEFEDGTIVERINSLSSGTTVKCNGKKTSGKSVNEFLLGKLGADAETYKALCNSDYLRSLTSKELSSLFLSILPATVSFEKFVDLANELLQNEKMNPLDTMDKNYLAEILNHADKFNIEQMESAYKVAYSDRRKQGAIVKTLAAKTTFDTKNLPKETAEEIQKQIDETSKEEANLINYRKQLQVYKDSMKKHEDAKKKKEELISALKTYEEVKKPEEKLKMQAEEDKVKFTNAINKSRTFVATAEANIKLFKRTLSSLEKPICPISEKLICTTDKSGLRGELEELLKKNNDTLVEYNTFIKRCEDQIAQRDAIINEYNNLCVLYTKKTALEQQVKDFIIPEPIPKPEEVKEIDFSEKKKVLRESISVWNAYQVALDATKEYEKENRTLQVLERAVRILDVKTGVPAFILKAALKNFETAANKKASQIKDGFELQILCDDGLEVRAKIGIGKEFLPLEVLSTGESILVFYLLMDIINQITGANYLVIDNLDALDKDHTESLLKLLKDDSSYEHIFIGAVDHTDTMDIVKRFANVLVCN